MTPPTARTVLVTGASDGIGLRLAGIFCAEGAWVVGTGSRRPEDLPSEFPAGARYVRADQASPSAPAAVAAALALTGFDRLDNLVLNAGHGSVGDPALEDPQELQRIIEINLVTPLAILRETVPMLETAGGLVTIIGSTARGGASDFASYAASKAGLAGLARALASEWQGRIGVQLIDPGPTATAMHARAGFDPGAWRRFFVDPKVSARRIRYQIARRSFHARIGIGPREVFSGLTGYRR